MTARPTTRIPPTQEHAQTRAVRDQLLRLHKAIITAERARYETANGPVPNEVALFHLVSGDPFFAWLRPLTVLIVAVDERLAAKEPFDEASLHTVAAEVREVLSSSESGNEFRRNYRRLLQDEPGIVIEHGRTLRLLPPAPPAPGERPGAVHRGERSDWTIDQGPFVVKIVAPGRLIPGHGDHGYGPLALVAESFLEPGTWIRLHAHTNDEIISYVPDGVMRHDEPEGRPLITDGDHLMIMNAGSGFWHEERTLDDDPPLRMLQILVRPHTLDLDPEIQHGPIPPPVPNEWRHLFRPDGSDEAATPFTVRNDVHLFDVRLDARASVALPSIPGWDAYLYLFTGSVAVADVTLGEAETALLTGAAAVGRTVTASEPSLLVAFLIDPNATVTRSGTVGR